MLIIWNWVIRMQNFAVVLCFISTEKSNFHLLGSTDSTIKIWDIVKQYCTHNFRGSQGVVQ